MPLYFFHLRNDLSVDDEERTNLPDPQAALEQGRHLAVDMAAASVKEHRVLNLNHLIEVADHRGNTLFVVKFGAAVKIAP